MTLTRQFIKILNVFLKNKLYFGTFLDIQKDFKDSTKNFHIPNTQFSLLLIDTLVWYICPN